MAYLLGAVIDTASLWYMVSPYWELRVRLNLCYAWTPYTRGKDGHQAEIVPRWCPTSPQYSNKQKSQ